MKWETTPRTSVRASRCGRGDREMYSSMRERRSGIGRLAWWAFWVVLIVYVVRHPADAAVNARALVSGLDRAAESVITFLQQSAGGAR